MAQVPALKHVTQQIFNMRGQRVILDSDLAQLYGVPTKVLNQAVKRNRARFPEDFVFQLISEEKTEVVTNCDHLRALKFSPHRPYAFTEHGVLMAASVLNSQRAIDVSIYVVRAFVKLRDGFMGHAQLSKKLEELERRLQGHDAQITALFDAIRALMAPPAPARRRIGFHAALGARR